MYRAYYVNEKQMKDFLKDYDEERIYSQAMDTDELEKHLLKMILNEQNSLNAEDIWDTYFPFITMPVFISHSSKDKSIARKLANFLYENFSIVSFIDSDLWGNIANLQNIIDRYFCDIRSDYEKKQSKKMVYSYELRNESTAHVHMILSYALTKMIDTAECFIFIKSDNSISVKNSISGTFSPWIFHELAIVDTISMKCPTRIDLNLQKSIESSAHLFNESALKVHYPVPCRKLNYLSCKMLQDWSSNYYLDGEENMAWELALNDLYTLNLEEKK